MPASQPSECQSVSTVQNRSVSGISPGLGPRWLMHDWLWTIISSLPVVNGIQGQIHPIAKASRHDDLSEGEKPEVLRTIITAEQSWLWLLSKITSPSPRYVTPRSLHRNN